MRNPLKKHKSLSVITPIIVLFITTSLVGTSIELDLWDVSLEALTTLICVYLLFSFERLIDESPIYSTLFASMSLLVIGCSISLLDELYPLYPALDMLGEVCQSLGFIIFLAGCIRWGRFHEQQLADMKYLAEIDSLTGVANRRTFLNLANSYFEPDADIAPGASILLIDIDNFKSINDTYGHPFGDQVLVKVAKMIKASLGRTDYVARLGGEEFVVLLPNASSTRSAKIAERIRMSVEALKIDNYRVCCTVSIGGATADKNATNFDALYQRADQAMYKAKAQGKNQYVADTMGKVA